MISRKELRIGNNVLIDNDSISEVLELGEKKALCLKLHPQRHEDDLWRISYSNVHGIPLTAEILESYGFENDGDFDNGSVEYYRLGSIHLQMSGYEDGSCYYVWRDNMIEGKVIGNFMRNKQYSIEIKSLHQLQNLYYILEGKELAIIQKENKK